VVTRPSVTSSVVVVNKGDVRVIRTLDALGTLEDPRLIEVVIVDASDGALDHLRIDNPDFKWVSYRHPAGKARTIAEQRNVGVQQSVGDVVIFLDANCVPDSGWLAALLDPIESGVADVVVGAAASRGGASVHDGPDAAGHVDEVPKEWANMNVAYRREVFDRVGPFDEVLGYAEDVDFAWRALDAGTTVLVAPTAVVEHDWGGASENFPRAFRYGVARVRLLRKHTSRRRRLLREDRYVLAYAAFLACVPFTFFFPWYLLLLLYPLAKNRHHSPFETVAYHLTYGAGALTELLHIPVTKGQRRH